MTKVFVQQLCLSLAIVALLTACTSQADSGSSWADFLEPTQERSFNTLVEQLSATQLPMTDLGSVRYTEQSYPLYAIRIKRQSKQAAVCIFAGVHGNEVAGTATALSLLADLAKNESLYAQTNFLIVPLVNPWGWERNFRYNFEGQDIARNFAMEGTQETALIKPLLAKEQCSLVVDLHEDSTKAGFYMLTYANPDPEFTPRLVQDAAKELGMPLATKAPQGVYHIARREFARNPLPTLAQYAREQGIEQTYIIETSMEYPLAQRVQIQRYLLDQLIKRLSLNN